MAKNDIFVHFSFFRFPNQLRKTEKGNILVGIFCFSIFPLLIKNEKAENWHPVHRIFYFSMFGEKMEKSQLCLFFVTFSIFWQIGEMSSILSNILFWF